MQCKLVATGATITDIYSSELTKWYAVRWMLRNANETDSEYFYIMYGFSELGLGYMPETSGSESKTRLAPAGRVANYGYFF
jgi:hypothetical protein